MSARRRVQLLRNESSQAAQGFEGFLVDFIVLDDDIESFFETNQDSDYGHGVQLDKAFKQLRFSVEAVHAVIEIECLAQYFFYAVVDFHGTFRSLGRQVS